MILIVLFSTLSLINKLLSQNEFAPIGSYWLYSVEPHDGNGFGWDKIKVTKDTIVDGKEFRKLTRTYYREQTLPPLEKQAGEYFFGLLNIENDSVFVNDLLIFDFGAEAGDTINVYGGSDLSVEIRLAMDSVTTISLDNDDYKRYYGNKFCVETQDSDPYEPFEVIETIGPVEVDFFSWNVDGCILGGGTATFNCFRNENVFNYPAASDCVEPFLTATENQIIGSLEIYPNPTEEKIYIGHTETILGYTVLDLSGTLIYHSSKPNSKTLSIDVSALEAGVYFVQIVSKGKIFLEKFIKV